MIVHLSCVDGSTTIMDLRHTSCSMRLSYVMQMHGQKMW